MTKKVSTLRRPLASDQEFEDPLKDSESNGEKRHVKRHRSSRSKSSLEPASSARIEDSEDTRKGKNKAKATASSSSTNEEQPELKKETREVKTRNLQRITLTAKDIDVKEYKFQCKAYGYLVNSFPTSEESTRIPAVIAGDLYYNDEAIESSERSYASAELRSIFRKAISDSRSGLVKTLVTEVNKYKFKDAGILPRNQSLQKKGEGQYRWLLNGSRFSRPDFDSSKGLLENKCLAYFIHKAFYQGGGAARLTSNDEVSKPLVILTYVIAYFVMAKKYGHRTVKKLSKVHFSEDSPWKPMYDDFMSGPQSKQVDWFKVLKVQQSEVDRLSQEATGSTWTTADVTNIMPDDDLEEDELVNTPDDSED
ncbi:hypothetical protein BJV82DRAFT_663588 [Fennellomyces sp. T-0311]|nr:hypothetical protein BJV82DRAFT_674665 [Fennellomyces sp. T-0311]KAI8148205.1 hypothetical protein BJV82DRAFT_663588 [Fennellomyces sp. T-0311]